MQCRDDVGEEEDGRQTFNFNQYKDEYRFITKMIKRLPEGTEDSNGGEEEDGERGGGRQLTS